MANAFTPFNKDQINKEIKPISNCRFKTGYWSVYNRWGQVILDRVPLTQAWDAMYMGEPVIPGVYIYMIYGIYDRSDAGVFQISGNIRVLE
jgi:gliding motility-associated-like protein